MQKHENVSKNCWSCVGKQLVEKQGVDNVLNVVRPRLFFAELLRLDRAKPRSEPFVGRARPQAVGSGRRLVDMYSDFLIPTGF